MIGVKGTRAKLIIRFTYFSLYDVEHERGTVTEGAHAASNMGRQAPLTHSRTLRVSSSSRRISDRVRSLSLGNGWLMLRVKPARPSNCRRRIIFLELCSFKLGPLHRIILPVPSLGLGVKSEEKSSKKHECNLEVSGNFD